MTDDPDNAPIDPASNEVWHLWFILFPRRSITGKLVRGLVWRRKNGRRWTYKRFTDPPSDMASPPLAADPLTPDHPERDRKSAPVR
jgi:hypothetical protein